MHVVEISVSDVSKIGKIRDRNGDVIAVAFATIYYCVERGKGVQSGRKQ